MDRRDFMKGTMVAGVVAVMPAGAVLKEPSQDCIADPPCAPASGEAGPVLKNSFLPITAHELAKQLLEVPDFEIRIIRPNEHEANTVYGIVSDGPAVSASSLVFLGIERLYGPDQVAQKS